MGKFRFGNSAAILIPKRSNGNLTPNQSDRVTRLLNGILEGNRASLSQSITLVESKNHNKRQMAKAILHQLLQSHSNEIEIDPSYRIGLSGPPGAGKSTFIENMGQRIISKEGKLAVLAVDPSSSRTGGSLLGDKTRMQILSNMKEAFIRPSPSGGELGGVARNTHEAAVLAEAAGFKNILIETVGVGQSEFAVADMVDIFVLIIPPAAGDELQGIKRGIVELADIVVVNKADGDLLPAARRVAAEYTSALKFMPRKYKCWRPQVGMISSLNGDGLDGLWDLILDFKTEMINSGEFYARRREQREIQMWNQIENQLLIKFKQNKKIKNQIGDIRFSLANHQITPGQAADDLLDIVYDN